MEKNTNTEDENLYLASLSKTEYQSYLIAQLQLGTSFTLHSSNGFLQWKKKKDKIEELKEKKL